MLDDGMQIERSAMYLGLTVMSLRIFAACPFLQTATRALARNKGTAAEAAWLFLTHDDGEIVLFNDAWIDETPSARTLLGGIATAAKALPKAGYWSLRSGELSLWFDSGEIGPRWNPGHGHADFLSIELDVAGERLLVDPGTSQYSTGARRSLERSWQSHNGPRYEGIEPVEYTGCFKVGRMAGARAISQQMLDTLSVPAIGGVLDTKGGRVARLIVTLPEGGMVIADAWSAHEPQGAVNLLIPATWNLVLIGDVTLQARSGTGDATLQAIEGAFEALPDAQWCRRFMAPEPAKSIVLLPVRHGTGQRGIMAASASGAPSIEDAIIREVRGVLDRIIA